MNKKNLKITSEDMLEILKIAIAIVIGIILINAILSAT